MVLVFGLAPAGHCIFRLTNIVYRYIQGVGHKALIYINDGLSLAKSKQEAASLALHICRIMTSAGFVINIEKSMDPGDACQTVHFLGFLIDSVHMTLTVTEDKVISLLALIENITVFSLMPVHQWACI